MKNSIPAIRLAAGLLLAFIFQYCFHSTIKTDDADQRLPNDYLHNQRAYPYGTVSSEAYYAAIAWAKNQTAQRSGPNWELAGPANFSGRITDIAMHPSDLQTIYVAAASGGLWKSQDAGQTWFPIGDGLPTGSIGDIAIDPSDKNTIYCGTGEPNAGGGSVTYDGRGIFKSTDGGQNWSPLGLEQSGSIGRIEVDPQNPKRIFVAAMGRLFSNNPERGIFRSDDGGLTWTNKLFVNDSTGAIDLAVHPLNPDTMYAVSWERLRRPHLRKYGGPGSAIYRSTDGGDSWTKLSGGFPQGSLGRIGISIASSSPNILYATVADETGYFLNTYKSQNHGISWTPMSTQSNPAYSSYGWWFGQIRAHPTNPNRVYNLGISWIASANGGASWSQMPGGLHVDHHALYIHPANPDFMVEGNDGGVYISQDDGTTWAFHPLPIIQFYTSEIDFQQPQRLYGGTQDNGTWRSTDADPGIWEHIWGGDGFVTLVNPNNNSVWYAESQYGGFGGSNGATSPPFARANWNAPYVFDPNNPDIMYFGGESLFKSTNGGLTWTAISGDLSDGQPGNLVYGTSTTIAVSPLDPQVIWAGTDDGNVWVTPNGGNNWNKVSGSLPKRWITRLVADPYDPSAAYVCLSGFRHFDDMAHVYRTTDFGQNWTSVSGNLPDIPVNDLVLDPLDPNTLIIATDAGVFVSYNQGANWEVLGAGMPNAPVLDLTFHAPTRALVAATYGRSMFRTQLPLPVGTASPVAAYSFDIFPNPVQERLFVQLHVQPAQKTPLRVWDSAGRLVFSGNLNALETRAELDTRSWLPGIYLVELNGMSRKVLKF